MKLAADLFPHQSWNSGLVVVGFVLVLGFTLIAAAVGAPVRLTIPFRIDRVMTASGMALELEAEDLGRRPVAELPAVGGHPSATVFKTLVGYFAANQPESAAALLRQGNFQSADDGLLYARNFSQAFQKGWPALTVGRRYDVGVESWFSWEVPQEGRAINRISRFAEKDGQWRWADELLPTPLRSMQTLASASEQLVLENQPGARAVEGMEFKHAVAVPGMKARWLFNGFSASWDAFGNGAVPDHPVTKAYAPAAKALYGGDFSAFAGAHLPYSGQRLEESVAQMDDAAKASFANTIRQLGRKVTFVLEASPVFLVFYETDGRGLQYDTLYAAGGDLSKLQFANFFVESFIDEIMKDRGLFQDPVIRPLAGRLEDPPKTAAVSTTVTPRQPAALPPEPRTRDSAEATPGTVPVAPTAGSPPFSKVWIFLLVVLGLIIAVILSKIFRAKS